MRVGRLQPRVLVVEDDAADRSGLVELLDRAGYEAIAVADGRDALRAAGDDEPDLVLLDVELPGTNGFDVCRELREGTRTATLPIILLTGRGAIGDIVAGIAAGADDFLRKPYEQAEVMARVSAALRAAETAAELAATQQVMAALANAVEAKDAITEDHCQRLAALAQRLGAAIALDPVEMRALAFGALLHDIGTIRIRDDVLSKPGPLSRQEWAEMRLHPIIGEQICEPLAVSRAFGPIIRNHHERWDGQGYPDGLRGDKIPIGARVVGVVDAYDAMVHSRPYRPARHPEQAIAELRKGAGSQFDPALVPVFVEILRAGAVEETESPTTALRAMRLAIP
jgi:putative two-component system response regulator